MLTSEVLVARTSCGSGDSSVRNRRTRSLLKVGDRVRIRPGGATVLVIDSVDEDGRLIVSPVTEAPGAYPFPIRAEDLIPELPGHHRGGSAVPS
jgi:hypothetical protein